MNSELIEQTRKEIAALMDAGRILDAVPLIRQCAHWGDLPSQRLLIDMFLHQAYGMPYEPAAAFEYVRMAALNGDPEAMLELAEMSRDGTGTAQDDERAFYFMQKAAKSGEKRAYDPLAAMLLMGKGTHRNLEEAEQWLMKARQAYPEDSSVQKHWKLLEGLQNRNQG